MRGSANLADDVYPAAKNLAEGSGGSLGEVLTDLVRRSLRPHRGVDLDDGLPLFAVPPDAEVNFCNRGTGFPPSKGFE